MFKERWQRFTKFLFALVWRYRLDGAKVIRVKNWRTAIVDENGRRTTVQWELFCNSFSDLDHCLFVRFLLYYLPWRKIKIKSPPMYSDTSSYSNY